MKNNPKLPLIPVFASIIAYVSLGYFVPREHFVALFSFFSIAFFSFIFLYTNDSFSERKLFILGIVFRVLFLFCLPFWSQDFYRFIWDGNLVVNGINPYLLTPNELINSIQIPNVQELYTNMGSLSASHYSNYPPVNQLFFAATCFFSFGSIAVSVLIFKLFIIFSDVGIYYFGRKILVSLNQNPKKIFLYFLNPLIIIELSGNLHFEGVMLFFFVLGLYLFIIEKWLFAAVFIAFSIATKLLPLLLLPFFYQRLGFKKSVAFYTVTIAVLGATFLPFVAPALISNYYETIGLWFTNFEFNASIYYLFRKVGFYFTGYNIIGIIGKISPVVMLVIVLLFALVRKNISYVSFFENTLLALSLYFFISTTVHPWYVVNLVFLSLFSRFKFPIIWSYFVVLSYFAYSQIPFKENYIILILEYSIVFCVLFFEIFKSDKAGFPTDL